MKKVFPAVIGAATIAVVLLVHSFYNLGADYKEIQPVKSIPGHISSAAREGIVPEGYIDASVIKVADGDTVDILYRDKTYKVRFLDIDTPESVKKDVPVQAYSKEASEFTKRNILNKKVRLVFEEGLRDRYGRLLSYILLQDGTLFNATLVRNGFARVEIIKPNTAFSDYFYELQDEAIRDRAGLWGLQANRQPFVKGRDREYVPRYQLYGKAS